MYNIKNLLEQRKKLLLYLVFTLIGLGTLGLSLIPANNYITGENMANNSEFILPIIYIILYSVFIGILAFIIYALNLISKRTYMVKKIDESIKGIKKGKFLGINTVPKRDELLQSHFAEKIKESGLKANNKIKIFDGMSQVEKEEIMGFKIDKNIDDVFNAAD